MSDLKLTLAFTDREQSLLAYALICAIKETKALLSTYSKCSCDADLAKESSDDLRDLKSLYCRFFPHLTVDQLFGCASNEVLEKGGAADEK